MLARSQTDIGRRRDCNQDYLYCDSRPVGIFPNLFIVADGMGGHNAGDFASRFCVEEFVRLAAVSKEKTIISTIETALRETNEQLISKARTRSDMEGMGTTFVLATVLGHTLHVANIGDSRLYLLRDGIRQITEDHSLVAEMIRNGEIRKEEARFHPNKNVVTKALSASGIVTADFFELPLQAGDRILLCSDGLSTMLADEEIYELVQQSAGIDAAVDALVRQANENGGKDNITVILIEMDETAAQEQA